MTEKEASAAKPSVSAPPMPGATTIVFSLLKWLLPLLAGILIGVVGR